MVVTGLGKLSDVYFRLFIKVFRKCYSNSILFFIWGLDIMRPVMFDKEWMTKARFDVFLDPVKYKKWLNLKSAQKFK